MTTSQSEFQLNRPGALIAALPAVLGFVPEKSLVLVTVDRGEMGCVMRVDLSPELFRSVGHLAEVAAAARPDAAIAVVVDAEGAGCRLCNDEYRGLAETLRGRLAEHGVELLDIHVVDRVASGGRWHCLDASGSSGLIDDPSASPLAVAAVLDGRRLYARRDELQQVIQVTDAAASAALARVIRDRADVDVDAARDIEDAMAAAAQVAAGEELPETVVARLACALTDPQVRDTLYALAVGDEAAQAEALWATLSPDASRAVARRGAGVVGVLRLCPRRRAVGGRLAGGGAALRSHAPDGGHARHSAAVGDAARTDSRTRRDRIPARREARGAAAEAKGIRPTGRASAVVP